MLSGLQTHNIASSLLICNVKRLLYKHHDNRLVFRHHAHVFGCRCALAVRCTSSFDTLTCFSRAARSSMLCSASNKAVDFASANLKTLVGPSAYTDTYTCSTSTCAHMETYETSTIRTTRMGQPLACSNVLKACVRRNASSCLLIHCLLEVFISRRQGTSFPMQE